MAHDLDFIADDNVYLALSESDVSTCVELVLREEGVCRPCLVSVSAVSDEHMMQLNKEWRSIAAPTDVLSLECERPTDPDLFEGEPCELGDIVLAPAYIERQAQDFGVSAQTETRLLLIHGLLHLLGYDHLNEDDAQKMEQREDELLAMLDSGAPKHSVVTRHKAGDDQA